MPLQEIVCSAPGKVILFGEHAVVYGTTAIAASLADCRMHCRISLLDQSHIDIHLRDFIATKEFSDVQITMEKLSTLLEGYTNLLAPKVPTEDDLKPLKKALSFSNHAVADGIYAICFLVANILPELVWTRRFPEERSSFKGLKIEIQSVQLPIGAGLGSSAAFSVAVAGALLQLKVRTSSALQEVLECNAQTDFSMPSFEASPKLLDLINTWAFAAETVIHGNPSGLDNTTSCYGGAVKFNKKDTMTFDRLSALPPIDILLTNTCLSRSTKVLVSKVRELHDRFPSIVRPILDSIEHISTEFISICAANEEASVRVDKLGALFRMNHSLLCALGVGHPALAAIVDASSRADLACKLTGAGGGGCAITLLKNSSRIDEALLRLQTDLRAAGFVSFFSEVGGAGVRWHKVFPVSVPSSV